MPDAKPERPTDALVRITSINICGSDLHMYEGRTSVEKGKVGDRVCLPFNVAGGAYKHFDAREDGWTKVVLRPAA